MLRVAGKDTDLLGIDRTVELAATRAAAAVGVGPEVVDFVEPEGWLVTRFIEGFDPSARASPRAGAARARRRDAACLPPRRRDPGTLRRARGRRGVPRHGARSRRDVAGRVRGRARSGGRIADLRAGQQPRPCHNDLLNANFIDDGERLRIVDWEYAGMGDPFFDLANFSINHELDADGRAVLLAAYSGDAHRREPARRST